MDLKELKTSSRYLSILNANGIYNIKDFFLYLPRDYEDRTEIKKVRDLVIDNTTQTTKGELISKNMINTARGKKLIEIILEDEIGNKIFVNIMNNTYYFQTLEKGKFYVIVGKPKFQRGKIIFWNPKIINSENMKNNEQTGRIYPIYSELMGIKASRFAKKILENIEKLDYLFPDPLPQSIINSYGLLNLGEAIRNIHFPQSFEKLTKAQYRIYFDKVLKIQIVSQISKIKHKKEIKSKLIPKWEVIKNFLNTLPFDLTNAQKKAIKICIEDICSGKPMLRLLQGDVGSGKTVVAIAIAYYIKNVLGKQSAILAPTEVLAKQHFLGINKFLLPLGIKIDLLTGSTSLKDKEKIKQNLFNSNTDIVVGTTAIIQDTVDFCNLGFVVIDEQHKFGVKQRGYLKKFNTPHILQMTATPIPRSLAIAFFGEFDVSIIDELPAGRKKIHTKVITENQFNKLKEWILQKIDQGQQVYIITPLIEESEAMENVANVMQEYENTKDFFSSISDKVDVLHGKMSSKDKDLVMNKFKNNKTKILVSTTVIEVGVDSPTATIILIKNSERFGLSQLHQLRGRVGRSDLQSYCFLMTTSKSQDTIQRLKNMEKYSDGFNLSQIDLQTRGGGEILGIKQSGQTDIPINILMDTEFLEKVQNASIDILQTYPKLENLNLLKKEILKSDPNILS
ncbi:ATP-dependent DNA helicase RecG [Candidatus Vampirococcus lugosii]|uniref:ATP-dependent DNA helicase RecG n=1 Tax=Candidatus Vampirococcus lugosii TaxID=2789015 RepID=A0ABS5QKA9_9BACT|nr:ATP-dependent DNA helicase RecG [Candidatus Vampirococcus lugosii]